MAQVQEANEKHYGGLADYRSSEGKKVRIPLKNSIDKTIKDILGGVKVVVHMLVLHH